MLTLGLLFMGGCVKTEEAFSGLLGRVALGPVEGAVIEVYDGSRFNGIDQGEALIASGVSDERGAFQIDIPDRFVGRTLVVVAHFPADDPLTPEDERARYIDFSNPGTNVGSEVVLNPDDGPWVSMIDFFDGLDVGVAITPWTTAVWRALQGADAAQVGNGNNRLVTDNARQMQRAMSVNLGLADDISRQLPAQPAIGGNHLDRAESAQDDTSDAISHLYSLIQLDRAARSFAAATLRADDNALDFISAMLIDAEDAVLDGMRFGEPVPLFSEIGAPDVIGSNASNRSDFLDYMAGFGPSNDEMNLIETSVVNEAFPSLADMQDAQREATGAFGRARIDQVSFRSLPNSGDIVLEIEGNGFLRDSSIVFSNNAKTQTVPSGSTYVVERDDTGADGEILSLSPTRMELLLPDLTSRTGFHLVNGNEPRTLTLYLRLDYDGATRNGTQVNVSMGNFSLFAPSAMHVLGMHVERINADGSRSRTTRQTNSYAAGTDPQILDPATQPVFALVCELYNGYQSSESLSDAQLDIGATSLELSGAALTHAAFGAGGMPVVVWPSDADRQNNALDLIAGQHATLVTRFVFDSARLLDANAPNFEDLMELTPHFTAGISSGGDVSDMLANAMPQLSTSLRASDPAGTAQLSDGGTAASATATAGDAWELGWQIDFAAATGPYRSALIESVLVEVNAAGVTTRSVVSADAMRGAGLNPLLALTKVSASSADGASSLPLRVVQGPAVLGFTFVPRADFNGAATITLTARWRDPATGESGEVTTTTMVAVVP